MSFRYRKTRNDQSRATEAIRFFWPKVYMEHLLDRFWNFPGLPSLLLVSVMLLEAGSTWYILWAIVFRNKGKFLFGPPHMGLGALWALSCLLILLLLSGCLWTRLLMFPLHGAYKLLDLFSWNSRETVFSSWSLITAMLWISGQFSVYILLVMAHLTQSPLPSWHIFFTWLPQHRTSLLLLHHS